MGIQITSPAFPEIISGPLTVTGQILAADGTAPAPGYAFASSTGSGMYWRPTNSQLSFATAGTKRAHLNSAGFVVSGAMSVGWASGTDFDNPDTFLFHDGAGIITQRNSTNAQVFRVQNTFTTVTTSGEWFEVDWQTTANTCRIRTNAGSSAGTVRGMTIQPAIQIQAATAGANVSVIAGAGLTSGVGGTLALTGGAGGATAGTAGGPVVITGGAGGSSNGTGGAVTITTGASVGATASGTMTFAIGSNTTTASAAPAASGAFVFTGTPGATSTGATGTGGAGSALTITLGDGGTATGNTSSTGGAGGALTLTAGSGGTITGTTTAIGGAGGAVTITAGNGATATTGSGNTAGVGGSVTITAGSAGAAGGNVAGGNVDLKGGAATGSGTIGNVRIEPATATPAGGSTRLRLLFGSTAGLGVYVGSGAPSVSAAQGSLYLRTDGSSSSTRLYSNSDGGTTWVAVTTAS